MIGKSLRPTMPKVQRTDSCLIPSHSLLSGPYKKQPSRVTTLRFPNLIKKEGLEHGIFSRHGGVSDDPYKSLNTGYATGDRKENVTLNLEIVRATLGAEHLALMNQVHGSDILVLEKENIHEGDGRISADALVTDLSGLALTVRQADCQGIILFDEKKKVLALVHCGWRGNVANILALTVEAMKSKYGCNPSHLVAAIGPSLGPCCAEFKDYKALFPKTFYTFRVGMNHFDLWNISQWQLCAAGLDEKNIELARICTKCHHDFFFSYRAEGITGRFATVAMLTPMVTEKAFTL